MKNKIKSYVIIFGIILVTLTWIISFGFYIKSSTDKVKRDLVSATNKVTKLYEHDNDIEKISKYKINDYRITIVDLRGVVIYDTKSGEKDNHINRPEIKDAFKNGSGYASRKSKTINQKTYYYAKKADDKIIRLSISYDSAFNNYNEHMMIAVFLLLLILILSIFTAKIITNQVMKPITEMSKNIDDLDKIKKVNNYKELTPIIEAIETNHNKIKVNEKIRRDFTANVSHELKTPLTSISGYAELIENGLVKNNNDIKDFAGKIHTESDRLQNLIRDILKLSELDEPIKSNVKIEKVDVYQVVCDVKESLQFAAIKNNIEIQIKGENPFYIMGDKSLFVELIYNLCDNAVKYNKVNGNVYINLYFKDGKKIISVKDTGIGIPKNEHNRIFERFYRVDKSRSKETGGTGLGLAIVKHISIQHNAEIKIVSEVNKGTEIIVEFSN